MQWNVVETQGLASAAQRLKTDNLKFFSSIEEASKDLGFVDLVFSSGALHCTNDPIGFLSKLLEIRSEYLFITRTIFGQNKDMFVTLQKSRLSDNGPGDLPPGFQDRFVYYPNVFVPLENVKKAIQTSGYVLKLEIVEDQVAYKLPGKNFQMYGLFCSRKIP